MLDEQMMEHLGETLQIFEEVITENFHNQFPTECLDPINTSMGITSGFEVGRGIVRFDFEYNSAFANKLDRDREIKILRERLEEFTKKLRKGYQESAKEDKEWAKIKYSIVDNFPVDEYDIHYILYIVFLPNFTE